MSLGYTKELSLGSLSVRVNSLGDVLSYLGTYSHDFRYSTDLKDVDFGKVLEEYSSKKSLPYFAFSSLEETHRVRKCSCYDFSLIACVLLDSLGFKSELLHIRFSSEEGSFSSLSRLHMVTRFYVGSAWYIISAFLYGSPVELLGPFYNILEMNYRFVKYLNVVRSKMQNEVLEIDSITLQKGVPSKIGSIFPVSGEVQDLLFWKETNKVEVVV